MNTQVLIVGNFGYKANQLDGQTVKTRNVYLLLEKMGYSSIKTIDTSYKSNILQLFNVIFKRQLIVFVGAENAFKYILPILIKLASISKNEIHYFHIGNVLIDLIEKRPRRIKFLKEIKMNYPETKGMADRLRNLGLKNLEVIPNFRVRESQKIKLQEREKQNLKLVYLGRILKEKGIDLILEAHKMLLNDFEKGKIEIDFYGQLVDERLDFEHQTSSKKGLNYKGFLNPEEITNTLAAYDALLFPTYFHEEGFPGTILDAYLAGIPVIASDWMYNAELVESGIDGLLFEPKSPRALADSMLELLNNPEKLNELKNTAIEKGKALDYKQVKKTFIKHVSKKFKP